MPEASSTPYLRRLFQTALPERLFLSGLILLCLLVGLSSINRGLQSDDYIHKALLNTHQQAEQQGLDNLKVLHQLFVFFDPQQPASSLPWWSNPEMKIKFWRPLSALSHYLDYQLWPNNIKAMHMHSMLWYLLLVLFSYVFFKQILGTLSAQWAAIIFCLDFSHFANLSWLANRNSLIASSLVLITCICFIKAYRLNKKQYFLFSICAYALALLAAEVSLLALFIPASYLYFFYDKKHSDLDNKNLVYVFAVYASVALIFLLGYQYMGYGISHSGLYLNPLENPLLTLQSLITKIPVFYFGQIFAIEGFYNVFSPHLKLLSSILCLLLLLVFFYFLKGFYKQEKVLFFVSNSLLALIPASLFALADMRLSLLSSVFSAALLAICLTHFYQYAFINKNFSRKYGLSLLLILFAHIGINGMQWAHIAYTDKSKTHNNHSLLSAINESYPDKNIYIFNHPKPLDLFYFDFYLQSRERGDRKSPMQILNNNFTNFSIEVLDDRRLKITSEPGFVYKIQDFEQRLSKPRLDFSISNTYAHAALASVFNSPKDVFKVGDRFPSEHYTAEITQVTKTGNTRRQLAKEITFTFARDFSEELAVFFIWHAEENRYQEINFHALLPNPKKIVVMN